MDKSFKAAAGAAVVVLLASGGAMAQQGFARLFVGPTQASQLGEASNAMAALTTTLVRGEPGRGGAGALDLASRGPSLSMTGAFEGLAPADISFSSQGRGDVAVTPWAELSALGSEDRLRRYEAQVLELGVDAMLNSGLTVSGSVALVRSDVESLLDAANTNGEGEGTIVTLAAIYEANGWTADAALGPVLWTVRV